MAIGRLDASNQKNQLIDKVLAVWKEDPVKDAGDERLKQELRVCGPALRVYMSFEAFEVRKKYFVNCKDYAKIEEVIQQGAEKLADYIVLGRFLVETGLDYTIGTKQLKQTPEALAGALQELIEKEHRDYSKQSQEDLEEELPGAVRGIEFFIAMYD